MRTFEARESTGRSGRRHGFFPALLAIACVGPWLLAASTAHAQTPANTLLLPADRIEIADEERISWWTLQKFPPQPYMNEIYWPHAPEVPAFFRDSLLQIVGRTYYFDKSNFDGSRSRAWTAGGWIAWRSGLVADMFGVHVALYTSQRLFGPVGEGGTRLLTADQDPINVVGQAYGRLQIVDNEIRAGRMLVDTPLINPQDSRMVPNTFEGVQVVSLPDSSRMYDYAAGYLWTMKPRDSNDFISMSDSLAGADVINRGVPFAMLRVRPAPGLTAIVSDYYVEDFINTAFGQVEYVIPTEKGSPVFTFGANVIDQRTVGANLLTGIPFNTYQFSGKGQVSYAGFTLFVVGSITGEGSKLFSPYGAKPNYTDMQQVSFDNAREKAFGGSIAYDFGQVGFNGFSVGAWYTVGWDAFDPVSLAPIANRNELDVWLQYRPNSGPLKGFRLKTQYSTVWQNGNVRDTQPEFRFIVDYTVLFRPLISAISVKG